MRVELQAPQVGHPGQGRGVPGHHLLGRAAGGKAQGDDLDPVRPLLGRALLVEELAVDSVGVADEHVRAAARSAQGALGHRQVVADDLELGDAGLGKVDLARVRDRDLAAAHLEDHPLPVARHPTSIRRPVWYWQAISAERVDVLEQPLEGDCPNPLARSAVRSPA